MLASPLHAQAFPLKDLKATKLLYHQKGVLAYILRMLTGGLVGKANFDSTLQFYFDKFPDQDDVDASLEMEGFVLPSVVKTGKQSDYPKANEIAEIFGESCASDDEPRGLTATILVAPSLLLSAILRSIGLNILAVPIDIMIAINTHVIP